LYQLLNIIVAFEKNSDKDKLFKNKEKGERLKAKNKEKGERLKAKNKEKGERLKAKIKEKGERLKAKVFIYRRFVFKVINLFMLK
jgi:hypothetical protein